MLRVDLTGAVPGMRLAMPIHHPRRPGGVLLRAGFELDHATIAKLQELGVYEAWIECPGVEFMADFVNPSVHAACHEVAQAVSGAMAPTVAGADPTLDFRMYKRAVVSLLEKLAENRPAAVFLGEIGRSGSISLRHACNVALVSVLVGIKLDFYLIRERPKLSAYEARDVSNLGVGALLHDLGMLRLPEPVLERWHRDHDESDPDFRRHVALGHELVRDHVDPSAAAVVLQHHQRFDGSGFPSPAHPGSGRPLHGTEIHVLARIATAADLLDRLRHRHEVGDGPAERPRIPMVRALHTLLKEPYRSWIDPVVLRAMLMVVPPYAPGTRVTLSDGSEGVVVGWNPHHPCRPTVAEIVAPRRTATPRPHATSVHIDLSRNQDLYIARAEGCDVANDNFEPPAGALNDQFTVVKAAV
ncbi:MAG: HD domain-containing protein [Phycisphaerales bacterium]|nr:HD domain-containing protein [Phycisphaerales bacterium]